MRQKRCHDRFGAMRVAPAVSPFSIKIVRMDALGRISKDPLLRDNPPNPEAAGDFHKQMGEYDRQLHVNDQRHDDIHADVAQADRLRHPPRHGQHLAPVRHTHAHHRQPRVGMKAYSTVALHRVVGVLVTSNVPPSCRANP